MLLYILYQLFIYYIVILLNNRTDGANELSPYNQHLPDCKTGFERIKKKPNKKGIVCPMIKDEEGFLFNALLFRAIYEECS
jgi:hypothetical protein